MTGRSSGRAKETVSLRKPLLRQNVTSANYPNSLGQWNSERARIRWSLFCFLKEANGGELARAYSAVYGDEGSRTRRVQVRPEKNRCCQLIDYSDKLKRPLRSSQVLTCPREGQVVVVRPEGGLGNLRRWSNDIVGNLRRRKKVCTGRFL